jgi:hypothetical protein
MQEKNSKTPAWNHPDFPGYIAEMQGVVTEEALKHKHDEWLHSEYQCMGRAALIAAISNNMYNNGEDVHPAYTQCFKKKDSNGSTGTCKSVPGLPREYASSDIADTHGLGKKDSDRSTEDKDANPLQTTTDNPELAEDCGSVVDLTRECSSTDSTHDTQQFMKKRSRDTRDRKYLLQQIADNPELTETGEGMLGLTIEHASANIADKIMQRADMGRPGTYVINLALYDHHVDIRDVYREGGIILPDAAFTTTH